MDVGNLCIIQLDIDTGIHRRRNGDRCSTLCRNIDILCRCHRDLNSRGSRDRDRHLNRDRHGNDSLGGDFDSGVCRHVGNGAAAATAARNRGGLVRLDLGDRTGLNVDDRRQLLDGVLRHLYLFDLCRIARNSNVVLCRDLFDGRGVVGRFDDDRLFRFDLFDRRTVNRELHVAYTLRHADALNLGRHALHGHVALCFDCLDGRLLIRLDDDRLNSLNGLHRRIVQLDSRLLCVLLGGILIHLNRIHLTAVQMDGVGAAALDDELTLDCYAVQRYVAVTDSIGDRHIVIGTAGHGFCFVDRQIGIGRSRTAATATTAGGNRLLLLLFRGGGRRTRGNSRAVHGDAVSGGADDHGRVLCRAGHLDIVCRDQNDAAVRRYYLGAVNIGIGADRAVKDRDRRRTVDARLGRYSGVAGTLHDTGFRHRRDITLRPVADGRRIRIAAQVRVLNRFDPERTAEHNDRLLARDGIVRLGFSVAAQHNSGCIAAVDIRSIPVRFFDIGEARVLGFRQRKKTAQNCRHLCARQRTVRVKLSVAALNNAIFTPAVDRAFRPVTGSIRVLLGCKRLCG